MMKKILLLSAILLLPACTPQQAPVDDTRPAGEQVMMEWKMEPFGQDTDTPQTHIMLVNSGTDETLFETNCTGTASTEGITDVEGSMASVRCWWAGGGDDYAVFDDADGHIVRHRTVDEEAGMGAWTDIQIIAD
jgi:hypothetical protein